MPQRRVTLRQRVEAGIAQRRDDAFLTREFLDLGGARQVLRVLREMTEQGKLIRLGYGVYGRAEISSLTNQPMLAGYGFGPVARQALDKLKVRWEPDTWERAYNEGRTTQAPVNPIARLVKSRFARRLKYQDTELRIER